MSTKTFMKKISFCGKWVACRLISGRCAFCIVLLIWQMSKCWLLDNANNNKVKASLLLAIYSCIGASRYIEHGMDEYSDEEVIQNDIESFLSSLYR